MNYIVNTSFMVSTRIHDRWLESLYKYYIPRLDTEKFGNITLFRVLTEHVEDHFTYSLQVEISDMTGYQRIVRELFPEYTETAQKLFGEDLMYFTSLLKKIDL